MRLSRVAVLGVVVLVGAVSVRAQGGAPLVGRWDAFVRANDADVPFPFEIVADGSVYAPQTAVLSGYGETGTVTGLEGAEAVVFAFPTALAA